MHTGIRSLLVIVYQKPEWKKIPNGTPPGLQDTGRQKYTGLHVNHDFLVLFTLQGVPQGTPYCTAGKGVQKKCVDIQTYTFHKVLWREN